jgi:hypothetical protein
VQVAPTPDSLLSRDGRDGLTRCLLRCSTLQTELAKASLHTAWPKACFAQAACMHCQLKCSRPSHNPLPCPPPLCAHRHSPWLFVAAGHRLATTLEQEQLTTPASRLLCPLIQAIKQTSILPLQPPAARAFVCRVQCIHSLALTPIDPPRCDPTRTPCITTAPTNKHATSRVDAVHQHDGSEPHRRLCSLRAVPRLR